MEGLLALVIPLLILGVILYLIQTIPMDPTIAVVIKVVIVVAAILFLLQRIPIGVR